MLPSNGSLSSKPLLAVRLIIPDIFPQFPAPLLYGFLARAIENRPRVIVTSTTRDTNILNLGQMLCETCGNIPFNLFISPGTFQHGTLHEIAQSAEAGCGFCELIHDSFELQKRRGRVRSPANVINEDVVLAHSSWLPILDLLYKDDIGQTDGAPLWFEALIGNEGHKQSPVNVDDWDFLLDVVESWENNCRKEHPACAEKLNELGQFLPSRLIKVSVGPDENALPRLVLTGDLQEKNIKYVTLSHRWGAPQLMASTTQSNIQARLSRIDSLPYTFEQAASLAKKLNIDYLWIDSFCIIQDDAADKDREIAMMASIYRNSFCNIVASIASDPTQGCYNTTKLKNVASYPLTFPSQDDGLSRTVLVQRADRTSEELSTGLESGSLCERGWLVQERSLPERAVVFTPRCIIWECEKLTAVRDYPDTERVFPLAAEANPTEIFPKPRAVSAKQLKFRELMQNETDSPFATYSGWLKLVEEYSQKKLTVSSDKLPAIGGLAKVIQELTGDEYVAGLWRRDLVRQLCWMQSEKQQLTFLDGYDIQDVQDWDIRKRYRAPTWSWAYLDLEVYYPEFDEVDDASQYFASAASPDVVDATSTCISTDSFGRVSSGSVTLRGKMVVITAFLPGSYIVLPFRNPVYQQDTLKRVRIFNRVGQAVGLIVLDRQNWTMGAVLASHSRIVLRCLRMWNFQQQSVNVLEDDDKSWPCKLIGLALRLVRKEPKQYERVGMAYLLSQEGDRMFENDGTEEDVTII